MMVNKELQEYNLSIVPDWAKKRPNPTPEEVRKLIEEEVGKDVIWPPRYYVLLKMYKEDDELDLGGLKLKRPEAFQKQAGYDNRVGRILAWGPDAFTDLRVFPSGCPYNIGDYVMFLKWENSFVDVDKNQLTYLSDINLTLQTRDPKQIFTGHQLGK